MRFQIAIAWASVLLCAFSSCLADDWTTTDGKTYHEVKDLGHNNLAINISSREGEVWLKLANLPPDIQKKYRYDATHEREMDAYLIRIGSGMPGVPPDPIQIQKYAIQVKQLLASPGVVRGLSPEQILWLQMNRLIVGGYLTYHLAPAEATDIKNDETKLIGEMLMAIEARVNPAIDTKKPFPINFIPYETMGGDPNDTVAKAAYDAKIAAAKGDRDREMAELQLKRQIREFVAHGVHYLHVLANHADDDVSIDDKVRPVMQQAGIDSASIDLLVGKTKASER